MQSKFRSIMVPIFGLQPWYKFQLEPDNGRHNRKRYGNLKAHGINGYEWGTWESIPCLENMCAMVKTWYMVYGHYMSLRPLIEIPWNPEIYLLYNHGWWSFPPGRGDTFWLSIEPLEAPSGTSSGSVSWRVLGGFTMFLGLTDSGLPMKKIIELPYTADPEYTIIRICIYIYIIVYRIHTYIFLYIYYCGICIIMWIHYRLYTPLKYTHYI